MLRSSMQPADACVHEAISILNDVISTSTPDGLGHAHAGNTARHERAHAWPGSNLTARRYCTCITLLARKGIRPLSIMVRQSC